MSSHPPAGRRVALLTGERGSGKSTVCLRLRELARGERLSVAGIVSVYRDARRLELDAVDLSSLERWPLASAAGPLEGPSVGRFSFSAQGIARALDVLERAAALEAALLVVDEIGPLELTGHEGFYPFLERARTADFPDLLLVVRPSLVDELRALLRSEGAGRPPVFEATVDTREALPARLLESFGREAGDAGDARRV